MAFDKPVSFNLITVSVDWGEDPTSFDYETVSFNMTSNETMTDLKVYYSANFSGSLVSGMYEQYETYLNDQYVVTIFMYHTYESRGTFFPIIRELGYIDNYTNPSGDVFNTCGYQGGEYQFNDTGPRNETTCMAKERENVLSWSNVKACPIKTFVINSMFGRRPCPFSAFRLSHSAPPSLPPRHC